MLSLVLAATFIFAAVMPGATLAAEPAGTAASGQTAEAYPAEGDLEDVQAGSGIVSDGSSEDRTAEDCSAEEHPAGEQAAGERSAEDRSAEEQSAEEQTTEDRSAEEQSAEEQTAEEQTAEESGQSGSYSTAEPAGEAAPEEEPAQEPAIEQDSGQKETGTDVTAAKEEKPVPEIRDTVQAFDAEKKAGKYVVRIHAEAGVLPAGTTVSVRELNGEEARPFARKAEEMADAGMAVAVIDITFRDPLGKEVKPAGPVDVTFGHAAEEDATVSVYHAPGSDVTRMEELSADENNDEVSVKSDNFSPFILLSASDEPDWTKGGAGTRTDISDKVQFTQDSFKWIRYDASGYGNFLTVSYTMRLNGKEVGFAICMDPRRNGEDVTRSEKTYEITAPMLVKAVYYGAYGPGKDVIRKITGTSDTGTNNIVTHIAAAEIYARLGYASKSKAGDGFIGTTAKLQEHVKKFVKAIEAEKVPDNYYLYISANSNGRKQDFGFGSIELLPHQASFVIRKDVDESDASVKNRIMGNGNYSLEGAEYGIYKTKDTAENLRKKTPFRRLTIGENGSSGACEVDPGTYYAVELKAPEKGGYIISNTVYTITLSSGEKKTLQVADSYKYVFLRIIKEPKSVPEGTQPPSLEGAVFEIYSDAKRDQAHYIGTLTTDADGKTEQLKADAKGGRLLLQTYYVKEVKAPAGYIRCGDFSIDTSAAAEASGRYTLVDRIVKESVARAAVMIRKESEIPEITEGNSSYSMAGAEFGVYSDQACTDLVEKIVTDEEGVAETSRQLTVSDYWIRELTAPAGFLINKEIIKVPADSLAQNSSAEITVKDTPRTDPAQITVVKRAAGGGKAASLAGTEFTFSYYKDLYKTESKLPKKPERSWTIRTYENNGKYVARIEDCLKNGTFVSGDEFYLDNSGNPTFPLGTVTIRETRAAEGYENDPDFGGGAGMLIANVILDSSGKAVFTVVQGASPVENTLVVEDTYKEPVIRTSAVDSESRSHTSYAGQGTIRITDTVTYENLLKNTDYTMYGTLMDKATEKPFPDHENREVISSAHFNTGDKTDGTVAVVFEFECDEKALKGHTLVVKEKLVPDDTNEHSESIPGAEHWDPDDADQTICFPSIRTSLREKESGSQIIPEGGDVELVDTVTYEGLMPGDKYVVIGTLMDQAAGEVLQCEGKEVTSTASFTAKEPNGTAEVTFRFSTKGLKGKSLTAFEELVFKGRTVAKHEDLHDAAQTVVIPGIETEAYDKETGKKNTLAAKDRVIVDKVSYYGLISGKTYEISGEVRIKPSDSAVVFDDAQKVQSEIVAAKGDGNVSFDSEKVTFVPAGNEGEAVSGVLNISFKTDASKLAGREIVVGETIVHNGVEIAVHRDIHDENQTDLIPDGKTVAIDASTGIKNTLAADNRMFKDTFRYENLIPGETYRFTGKVMAGSEKPGEGEDGNAEAGSGGEGDGESGADGGQSGNGTAGLLEEIPSVMTDRNGAPLENGCLSFVPDKKSGTLELFFMIDASELADREVTVFEKVTLDGKPVIIHEALDGTQTVFVPDGNTAAVDSETKDRVSMPDEEVSVIDTMAYRNLIPGKEYTVKGRVIRKTTGEEVKSALTETSFAEGSSGSVSAADGTAVFIPGEADGALELTFTFSAAELAGEDVVLFERVYHNGSEVIVHENIDDEMQTVHFPNGSTFASDPDTGGRAMKAGGRIVVRDEFAYENLLAGRQYSLTGKVMLISSDGKEARELDAVMMDEEGRAVTDHVFTPAAKDGSEFVYYEIDSTGLEGRSIVLFETLKYIDPQTGTGTVIASHEDPDDEEETIRFPSVRTTATDKKDGDHKISHKGNVTITDKVECTNLMPGNRYRVSGVLMNKSTGEPAKAGGSEITGEAVFTAKQKDCTVTVPFTFDSSKLGEGDYVVFETLYEISGKTGDEAVVGIHRDLDDASQTVKRPATPAHPGNPATGDEGLAAVWLSVLLTAAAGLAASVFFGKKCRK